MSVQFILARDSFNESVEEDEILEHDTAQRWSLNFLKTQFSDFEELYTEYISRLQYGYYSLYLILQFLLSASYSLVIIFENYEGPFRLICPDIILYTITAIIPIIAIFIIKEKSVRIGSIFAYVLIYSIDTFLPIFHYFHKAENMRTPFTTHLIIACYIFFAFNTFEALATGSVVTVTHLVICGTITFENFESKALARKLVIELIYFGCINALGVYFRYMNEIMYRRSFLAKKDETNEKILMNDHVAQQQHLLEAVLPPAFATNLIKDKKKLSFLLHGKVDVVDGENEHEQGPYFFKNNMIATHENVTILYADIVNYTQMTEAIPATHLVHVLDALFGGFDDDSEELKVMRIKFLGDCYYCVSGMGNSNPNHADSCVQLGLRMITRIKELAAAYTIDLNMRIGIHTGNIYSALIGRTKWQSEIWSKDVQFANMMESSGFPGKIHLTQETMNELTSKNVLTEISGHQYAGMQHAKGSYYVYKTNITEKVPEVSERTSMTYVVSPVEMPEVTIFECAVGEAGSSNTFRKSRGSRSKALKKFFKKDSTDFPFITIKGKLSSGDTRKESQPRRSGSKTIIEYLRDNEVTTKQELRESIREMPLTKYDQWFKEKEINPFFLLFYSWPKESSYILLEDQLYKYAIISVLIVLICFITIRYIAVQTWEYTSLLSILTAFSLVVLSPILFLSVQGKPNDIDVKELKFFERLCYNMPKRCYKISKFVAKSTLIRTTVYVILISIFTGCFVIELIHCNYTKFHVILRRLWIREELITLDENYECLQPWNITETINLTLIMSFLFLRIHVWIKFVYGATITIIYSYWIWEYGYDYYDNEPSFHYMMKPPVSHIINIIYLTTTLHFIDRQADYLNRLDHKWNLQLVDDKEKSAEARNDTLLILEKIMPFDVATKYLKRKDDTQNKKLYYERYSAVAVMFATITDKNAPNGVLDHEDEKLLLTMLNEIISDFDHLLTTEQHKGKVEKIKLANLKTYVACSGLKPGKKSSWSINEDAECMSRTKQKLGSDDSLIDLLEYAVAMRKALKKHNGELQQNYELRIGICDGKLTAGVIGSKKPYYDIWGDCVNLASRMDTCGKAGEIQVNDSTEMVLRRNMYSCRLNKYQYIKGKDYMNTYFVDLDENGDLIKTHGFNEDDEDDEKEDEEQGNDEFS